MMVGIVGYIHTALSSHAQWHILTFSIIWVQVTDYPAAQLVDLEELNIKLECRVGRDDATGPPLSISCESRTRTVE